jgi:TolB protein
MSKKASLVVVGGVIGCSLLLLCLLFAAIAGYTYFSSGNGGPINRIAYTDNANNIQIVDASGKNRVALTSDSSGGAVPRAYLFPTWSPNSQRIAYVGVAGGDAVTATLYTASVTGGTPATVFKSSSQTPFYLYWSPDSQWIGFLAQTDTEMSLMLGREDGGVEARKLETGSPFYWAWSPDSRALLLHIGGSTRDVSAARLALLGRDSTIPPQALKAGPANFQAPHYSPDGTMILYAATNGSADDALFLADAHGTNERSIATFRGSIAFAWSPNGKKIASMVTQEDAALPNIGPIWVSDADGSNRQQLITDDTLAFYWSPDSQQIAYLTIVQAGNGTSSLDKKNNIGTRLAAPLPQADQVKLGWRVMNLADKRVRTIAAFDPTPDFLQVLPYFDQYARSITFWSPDSRQFVYTQSEGSNIGSVWVADVAGSGAPQRIGDGTVAVWSWK